MRRTEELPAFTKLVVSDELRVRVVKGNRNRATISTNAALGGKLRVEVEVWRDGTLKIDSRLQPLYFLMGLTRGEVLLEVTDLRSVVARNGASVTIAEGVGPGVITARGGSLVLCEGSLSGVATKGSVGEISYGAER